jgi:hypothetical protein
VDKHGKSMRITCSPNVDWAVSAVEQAPVNSRDKDTKAV